MQVAVNQAQNHLSFDYINIYILYLLLFSVFAVLRNSNASASTLDTDPYIYIWLNR